MIKITEFDVQAMIIQHWHYSALLIGPNVAGCDVLIVSRLGYAMEFEIKVNRHDFWADRHKRIKHQNYRLAFESDEINPGFKIPNKFAYVVPCQLNIREREVPAYAGLYYIERSGDISCIKHPPFIHHVKLNTWAIKIGRSMNYRYLRNRKYFTHEWPCDAEHTTAKSCPTELGVIE